MHDYYVQNNLHAFHKIRDGVHDFNFVMRKLGKNIIKNIDSFQFPHCKDDIYNDNPSFSVFTFNDDIKNEIKKIHYTLRKFFH
ncbi:hypothetical protein QRU75_001192 [Campylobacter coli]|uniref:hypothetical protein n=1 Tax=Campylobacter coli TaxID=195 RepID=UPI000A959FDF|nr:hypothetical protein [Campylobacter coli]EIZ6924267.1 hypothetical protein [Campylobacter coli]EJC2355568.1 hypothetical protein [Campylobacter coli]ELL6795746.1 hypothetical protein [Campylobacter coli]ELR6053591.1 hypothetical protein [Campylobacter coli]EMB5505564.1 hypothetical protein [Campylobacter coli]